MENYKMPPKICEIKEDDLMCSICMEIYFIPTRIQCNHTFCSVCLFRTMVSKLKIEEMKREANLWICLEINIRIFRLFRSTVENVMSFEGVDPLNPPCCPLCRSKITKTDINFKLQGEIEQMFKQRPREEWAARKAEELRKLKECFQHYMFVITCVNDSIIPNSYQGVAKMDWKYFIMSAALTVNGISEHKPALLENRVENQPDKVFGVQNWEDFNMSD